MSYDINLYRAAKSARLAAEQPKYADLCPTEPTPEDDARVLRERNAVYFSGAAALPQVEADVPAPIAPPKAEPVVEVVEVVEAVVEQIAEAIPQASNAV